jgi:hypothetical protein
MILDSADDFSQYKIPGSGSEINPYVIENLRFHSENLENYGVLLLIESLNFHIIIRNCSFTGGYFSISLVNLASGSVLIENNTFISSLFCLGGSCLQTQYAIKILGSENIFIENNSFSGINGNRFIYGVMADDSAFMTVKNNVFDNSYYGFYGEVTQNVSIEGNSFLNNSDFYLRQCSFFEISENYFTDIDRFEIIYCNYFEISNNSFHNNINNIGLNFLYCENITFVFNILINGTYGLVIEDVYYSLIQANYFENITYEAIRINYGEDNLIFHNSFYNNNVEDSNGIQAFCEGLNNWWYSIILHQGNFWSNLGSNSTYVINGSAGSIDLYPLSEPLY